MVGHSPWPRNEVHMNQYVGIYRRCELMFIRNELERFGLQPLEGKALIFLGENRCSQESLCSHFDIDKGRVARILFSLEEMGLVERRVNDRDKREKLVSLTEEGGRMLQDIHQVFRRWDEICFTGFTEPERQMYLDFSRRMAENAMEYRHRQGGER